MKKITFKQFDITFLTKINQKSIRLRINAKNQLILSAPLFISQKKALQFLADNEEWINKNLNNRPASPQLINGATLSILGTNYTISHNSTQKGPIFTQNNTLYVGGDAQFISRRITNYANKQLLSYITPKAHEFATQIGEKPNKITLRNTTSRWGSCSSNKNLNFCTKLAFAPLFVTDYIIAHEVAHLKEMNHSPAFWATVAKLNTNQAESQIWLRKNGKTIQGIE